MDGILLSDSICVLPEHFADDDLTLLQNYYHGGTGVTVMPYAAPNTLVLTVALQLSNGGIDAAVHGFLEGIMKPMWKNTEMKNPFSMPLEHETSNLLELGRDIPQCLSAVKEVDSRDTQEDDSATITMYKSRSRSIDSGKETEMSVLTDGNLCESNNDHEDSFSQILDGLDFLTDDNDESLYVNSMSRHSSAPRQLYEPSSQPLYGDVTAYFGYANNSSSSDKLRSNYDKCDSRNIVWSFRDRIWERDTKNKTVFQK